MTIQEAISIVRARGGQLSRRGNVGTLEEWVHTYKILEDDMMADDWTIIQAKQDITVDLLANVWDDVASQFRTVKNSQESPVFQMFISKLKEKTNV